MYAGRSTVYDGNRRGFLCLSNFRLRAVAHDSEREQIWNSDEQLLHKVKPNGSEE